ncbi:MAG: DUF2079 domain-containing protein [Bacteroidales bacterium]|nr:DUF2079 domain-containing protein [Bacteroidales bacterium]
MIQGRSRRITLAAIFIAAGVLYVLISLVNHYLFRTWALDLGFYTHIMYNYAHLRSSSFFMFDMDYVKVLCDHFDLYLLLLSPLVYVFGSYTLLVIQIASILLGGWGVYKLIGLYTDDEWIPIFACAVFFVSFGIIHALSFDYHSNVLATMMLPWLLYYIKLRRFGLATLFVVLFVIGKENMSLWLFFILIALLWDYRKDKKTIVFLLLGSVFSLVYFLVINLVVMPKLGGSGGGFTQYAWLGDNYLDIAKKLLTHPGKTMRILFTNTTVFHSYDGIKVETYCCVLASGLLLAFLKPNYLLMLIPLFAQKMLSSHFLFWGISNQYSVEFVPVLVIAAFLVILRLKKRGWRYGISALLFVSVLMTTFYTITSPKVPIHRERLCVYLKEHYRQEDFDVRYAHHLIKQIPKDGYVCAASMFVSHLALREKIEDFEWNKNTEAEYVLIPASYLEKKHPDGDALWRNKDAFEVVETDGNLFLMKRSEN